MELPIKFPSDADVIREEVTRFRALSPDEQVHELCDAYNLYYFLREQSGRAEEIDRLAEEEERRGQEAVMAFAKKYG